MSFRVEPAVELNVAQLDVHIPELISHLEKRADVSKRFLKSVIVLRPVIGPIAEVLQAEIGIIGRTLLAGQIREKVTPGLECAIDARRDHERAHRDEARRDILDVSGYPTDQLVVRAQRQCRIHVMGSG
ncbi:MAG: hypothetical protein Udaeo_10810 [Candidatus Udaeobacter sp.]|nr:MAG: hypothetical protein Udaeo_10810 [Candidatus Udaeobacter sp.]